MNKVEITVIKEEKVDNRVNNTGRPVIKNRLDKLDCVSKDCIINYIVNLYMV